MKILRIIIIKGCVLKKRKYLSYAVAIAQLGERKTEDLEVTGSIPVGDK